MVAAFGEMERWPKAAVLTFALSLAAASAHAGGLAQSLGAMGAFAQGYADPYGAYQLQQQLNAIQQYQALQSLQNGFQSYQFPNGRRLNCYTVGQITRCN